MLSRKTVGRGLAVYWTIVWAAVVFQIDQFPLTWVPMYSELHAADERLEVRASDKEATKRGLLVTQRDGTTRYVTREDLNVTPRHFRRLYRQRLFGGNPAEEWPYRVLRSLNRTLGREPDAPDFIVNVESEAEFFFARKSDLHIEERVRRRSSHGWKDEYDERWAREGS